jgi:hypothetical protein
VKETTEQFVARIKARTAELEKLPKGRARQQARYAFVVVLGTPSNPYPNDHQTPSH